MVYGKIVVEVAKHFIKRHAGNLVRVESNIITTLPPAYRETTRTILRGINIVSGGNIVASLLNTYMLAPDSPGNGVPSPFRKDEFATNKSYQARNRQSVRNRSRYSSKRRSRKYNRYSHPCCC